MKSIHYVKYIWFLLLLPALVWADGGKKTAPARVVTGVVIEQSVAEKTRIVGTICFDRLSRLSSEVSGLVDSVHFKEGDHVSPGDVLIRLNRDFIKNEIASVKARIEQVNVRLAQAEKDLERYRILFKKEAVSAQEFDKITLSREDLIGQKRILDETFKLAELKDSKSIIRAPFDGIVLEKHADTGNWVSPGSVLANIGSLKDVYVKAPVSEKLLVYSKKGQVLDVKVIALDKDVKGIVDGFIPVADPVTKNIFVKIRIPRLETIALNMSASVNIPSGKKQTMTLVPRDALMKFKGQNMVYTVKGGKASLMIVDVITYLGEYVGVKGNGVAAGLPVVVDGNDRLRPDQAVTIINKG